MGGDKQARPGFRGVSPSPAAESVPVELWGLSSGSAEAVLAK